SPDGKSLVKWSFSGKADIAVFDAASGREVEKWKRPSPDIQGMALAPVGGWAAFVNRGGDIFLYRRGKLVRRLERSHPKGVTVSSMVFSPNGASLLAAEGRQLARYETATGRCPARREMWADHMAFRPDGKEIACEV